jgi:hypothetical protein
VSVNEKGEHEQQVWLSDAQIDLLTKAVKLYRNQLLDWTLPETRARAEELQRLLEELK